MRSHHLLQALGLGFCSADRIAGLGSTHAGFSFLSDSLFLSGYLLFFLLSNSALSLGSLLRPAVLSRVFRRWQNNALLVTSAFLRSQCGKNPAGWAGYPRCDLALITKEYRYCPARCLFV